MPQYSSLPCARTRGEARRRNRVMTFQNRAWRSRDMDVPCSFSKSRKVENTILSSLLEIMTLAVIVVTHCITRQRILAL